MLSDGRFWIGVAAGALAYHAWTKYKAKSAS
jgi:hypothetical protein